MSYFKDKGYKVKFYCENVKSLLKVIKDSRRTYSFSKGEVKILKHQIIEPYTVITDFKTLMKLEELKIYIICKKVLIMDSLELSYNLKNIKSRFTYSTDVYKCLKCFYAEDITFLMPPNNYKLFIKKYPDLQAKIYFKTINIKALNSIKHENRQGYFFRWDDKKDYNEVQAIFGKYCYKFDPIWTTSNNKKVPLEYKEKNHIFDYSGFIYRRRKYLEYQEQFGRLIFEYILLGKIVHFLKEKYTEDGLTDYLKFYNIEFKDTKIITTKRELNYRMQQNLSIYKEL